MSNYYIFLNKIYSQEVTRAFESGKKRYFDYNRRLSTTILNMELRCSIDSTCFLKNETLIK